jgi:pimeloyl-ACP methyl ester carboxylesterase
MLELSQWHAHVEEQGAGPSLVLVHGFGGDFCSWDGLLPHLGQERHLLRYDLRDFGLSRAKSEEAFTHAGDLAELLAAKSIDRCDLAGVSMGGGIALRFALDHPERVRKLVLISPQITGWEWSAPWQAQWQVITTLAREGRMADAKQLWWEHKLFETTRATDAAAALREEIEHFAGQQWVRDNHALVFSDVERIHQLQVPTLLLTGERDLEEFRLMADIIEASSEQVRRVDIPGAGHLLHMEMAELCARHIEAFLSA